jgi:hypothetical protein
MKQYRVYLLNDLSNIFWGKDVEAHDDAAVIAITWKILEAHDATGGTPARGIEVWHDRDLIFTSLKAPYTSRR